MINLPVMNYQKRDNCRL